VVQRIVLLLQVDFLIIGQQRDQHIGLQETLLDLNRFAVFHVVLEGLAEVDGAIDIIVLQVQVLGDCLLDDGDVALGHVALCLEAGQFQLDFTDLLGDVLSCLLAVDDFKTEQFEQVAGGDVGSFEQGLPNDLNQSISFLVGILLHSLFQEQ